MKNTFLDGIAKELQYILLDNEIELGVEEEADYIDTLAHLISLDIRVEEMKQLILENRAKIENEIENENENDNNDSSK